jgi:branched-chain amino acid transport system substrate-binding protein
MKSITAAVAASLVLAVSGTAANAQISDDVVKIGVLTDMSSLYADATGKGSLEITDTHALGAKETRGLIVTDAFYWDMNDETRAFSKRFNDKVGHMPTMIQAGLYSATMHYLKAIEAIGTDEAPKVMEQMRATPINDFFAHGGKIRIDGRMVHDMYLFEVKKPEESRGEWDLYKLLATVPGDEAFRPLDKGGCPLVKMN